MLCLTFPNCDIETQQCSPFYRDELLHHLSPHPIQPAVLIPRMKFWERTKT